jgi:hypothetical protein
MALSRVRRGAERVESRVRKVPITAITVPIIAVKVPITAVPVPIIAVAVPITAITVPIIALTVPITAITITRGQRCRVYKGSGGVGVEG